MMTYKWVFNAVLQRTVLLQLTVIYIYQKHKQEKDRLFEQRVKDSEVERASFVPLVLAASGGMGKASATTPCAHQTPALQHHRGLAECCIELRSQ